MHTTTWNRSNMWWIFGLLLVIIVSGSILHWPVQQASPAISLPATEWAFAKKTVVSKPGEKIFRLITVSRKWINVSAASKPRGGCSFRFWLLNFGDGEDLFLGKTESKFPCKKAIVKGALFRLGQSLVNNESIPEQLLSKEARHDIFMQFYALEQLARVLADW